MDGAWLGSIDIAINKAFTAKAFDISTRELGQNSQPGDQFFGIHVSSHDRVMIFAGGIPLTVSGVIVGASAGAFIQASISSRAFRTTGIAFGWIAPISFRKPFRGNLANPRGTAGNDHRLAFIRTLPIGSGANQSRDRITSLKDIFRSDGRRRD